MTTFRPRSPARASAEALSGRFGDPRPNVPELCAHLQATLEREGSKHGGIAGFRSFAGFVRHTRTAVVVLADSARDVETIALRLLRTIDEP